jgi:hypothetical protein
LADLVERCVSIMRCYHLETIPLQIEPDQSSRLVIIFDNENLAIRGHCSGLLVDLNKQE